MIPSAVLVLAVALQIKLSLSNKFEKSLAYLKDVYTCFADLKKAYVSVSLGKL